MSKMHRRVLARSLVSAVMALALVVPGASARVTTTTTEKYVLSAGSLDCDYRGETDCVNALTTVTSSTTHGGTFCVDVTDNHELHPPAALGCGTPRSGDVVAGPGLSSLQIGPTSIPATYSADCYRAGPDEGCVPRGVTLIASASFRAVGAQASTSFTRRTGARGCLTFSKVTKETVNVVGTVTVDGFVYDFPGTSPDVHTSFATLTVETTRTRTAC